MKRTVVWMMTFAVAGLVVAGCTKKEEAAPTIKIGVAGPHRITSYNVCYTKLLRVPPLEEQKRIVAKVDQLMALCDQLETKLKQTQTTGEKLVEATVKSLVAA